MLAALHAVAALGTQASPLSKILKKYQRYFASGEINSTLSDPGSILARVEELYGKKEGVRLDHLDGLTVEADAWWFNLRASNTEPLLRLNVEAKTQIRLERVRDEVLALIRG
jgi:phosphomannomutase